MDRFARITRDRRFAWLTPAALLVAVLGYATGVDGFIHYSLDHACAAESTCTAAHAAVHDAPATPVAPERAPEPTEHDCDWCHLLLTLAATPASARSAPTVLTVSPVTVSWPAANHIQSSRLTSCGNRAPPTGAHA